MAEPRKGRQTPTKSIVLPYTQTRGQEAIDLYNSSGRTAQEWQELLIYDILAVNEDGLWPIPPFPKRLTKSVRGPAPLFNPEPADNVWACIRISRMMRLANGGFYDIIEILSRALPAGSGESG